MSVRVIVVGAGWRAGRTVRAIAPLEAQLVDDVGALAAADGGDGWVWLLSAGAWRADGGVVEAPLPSATRRPVIGVGAVRVPAASDGGETLPFDAGWGRALDESGGLFEDGARLAALPIASALVPAAWLADIATVPTASPIASPPAVATPVRATAPATAAKATAPATAAKAGAPATGAASATIREAASATLADAAPRAATVAPTAHANTNATATPRSTSSALAIAAATPLAMANIPTTNAIASVPAATPLATAIIPTTNAIASVPAASASASGASGAAEAGGDTAVVLGRAVATVAAARGARVVRLPELDVALDPRPRALLVVTTLQIGGAERVVAGLARALPRRGIAPVVAVLGRVGRPPLDDAPPSIDLADARARGRLGEALADVARRGGCDLLHAHLLGGRDLEATRAAGLPVVVTAHNARPAWPAGLERLGPDDARLIVACALSVEDELRASVATPLRTAWNAIEVARHRPIDEDSRRRARAQLGLPLDALVMVTTANGRTQKRLDRLPAVVAALATRGRDARLLLVGDLDGRGTDAQAARAAFDDAIAQAGVAGRVRTLGLQADVAGALAAAEVYISTSSYEGMSLAMLEALASGLPVVSTAVGGAAELARAGAGLTLVAPDAGAETIAAAIADTLVESAPLAPPAVAAWRRRLDRDVAARRHATLYARAIAPRAAATPRGIILVINNFSTGGAQSSARRLLVGAQARGVPVLAITLQEDPRNPTPGRRALEAAGVPVLAAPPPEVATARDAVAPILDVIDRRPDARVLFWNALAEHKLRLADALLDRPPVDVSPGEMLFEALERFVARFAGEPEVPLRDARDYGRRLAAVVVKYAGEAERARALGAPVHVIPNGVPLGEPVLCARDRSDGRIVIGTAARLSPQKRLEDLLGALRLAAPRLPPSTILRIAGETERGADDYVARLKREAAGLPVEWVGEVEAARFLPGLDLFAMISAPAGCPNASLEAMAAGLPVVVTDVGGAREQVEDGAGLLVPDGDLQALADALVATAHDEALRRGLAARARARIAERFSVKRMIDDYLALLGIDARAL